MEGILVVLCFWGSNSKREVRVTLPMTIFTQNCKPEIMPAVHASCDEE